jgi:hypothetical protein
MFSLELHLRCTIVSPARRPSVKRLGKEANSAHQMLLHCGLGYSESPRNLFLRQVFDSPHPHDFPAPDRQSLKQLGEFLQLLAPDGAALRGKVIYEDVQSLQIRSQIDRHDTVTTSAVDQQVARNAEQECFG